MFITGWTCFFITQNSNTKHIVLFTCSYNKRWDASYWRKAMSKLIESYAKEDSKLKGHKVINEAEKADRKKNEHDKSYQNNFNIREDANFERCVNFMARMIEKYSNDVE